VDDDLSICETLREGLEGFGFEVLTAHNGADALEILKRSPCPSVILLDMMMPVMNGEGFLRARRNEPSISGIPVIVLTAFPNVKAEGANALLRKPLRLKELVDAVSKFCRPNREPGTQSGL
jgi:CheY-like chemotaxis protein